VRFHCVTPQTSTIIAYNLGLCKMLSVATGRALLLPTLLADHFPESLQHRKIPFFPMLPTRNKEKCANALVQFFD